MASELPRVQVHVLRVFCDDHDDHGNALGVVVDGGAVPDAAQRQEVAFELGFSETVFIDDVAAGDVRIYTPATELALAGHPLVGTAWLLAHLGTPVNTLRPPAGAIPCGAGAGTAWIEADPELAPPWRLDERATPDEVDDLDAESWPADGLDYVWAWLDEGAGTVRVRALAKSVGIVEDEATGSAALRLCQHAARPIGIHQGRGSVILAEPVADGLVRVTGRVVMDRVLTLDV